MWRKSSYSSGEGQCVEVRFDTAAVYIRDSKYLRDPSNDPAAQPAIAIEANSWPVFLTVAAGSVPDLVDHIPSIERTKDGGTVVRATDGTTLHYTSAEWDAFVAGIRAGEFSLIVA
ncbi:DUF397 domain-containing protein [Nocardia amamiensis]|uniref:DUF397 domain-containing protein n=1 Tax=Nocardia amamiensis TaxID=404578 RepID=UPI0033E64DBA